MMESGESRGLLNETRGGLSKKGYLIVGAIAAWNILLFILVVVALTKERVVVQDIKNDSTTVVNNPPLNYVSALLPYSVFQPELVIPGKVVSYDEEGHLTLGGGTTIYRNITTYSTGTGAQISHLYIDRLNDLRVLVFHDDAVISGDLDPDSLALTWNGPETPTGVSGDGTFAVLNEQLAVLVVDDSLIPIVIDVDGSIKLGTATQFWTQAAVDSHITRLSDSTFALSFFATQDDQTTTYMGTLVGVVSLSSSQVPSISISPIVIYSYDDHTTHNIVPLSSSQYILLYPNTTEYNIYDFTPMAAVLVTVDSTNTKITLSPPVFLEGASTMYFFDVVQLNGNSAAVVYVDTFHNLELKASVVTLANDGSGLFWGATVVLNEGHASGVQYDGRWLHISASIVYGQRFMVVYSDLANDGRVTTVMVEFTDTADLITVSPQYIISGPNPNDATDYYWVAAVGLSAQQFIIMDSLTGADFQGAQVTIGDMKYSPLGIVKGRSGTTSEVYINGLANVTVDGGLARGRRYFCTTQGDLVYSDNTDFRLDPYPDLYIVSGNLIVSLTSYIGVAVSENLIALHL